MDTHEIGFFIFLALIVIIPLVAAYYQKGQKEKRQAALFAVAHSMGLDFHPTDPFAIPQRYAAFDLMQKGYEQASILGAMFAGADSGKRAYNVISGSINGIAVKCFDYEYVTGNGKSQTTHYVSAIIIDTNMAFRELAIRPETMMDRVSGALGFPDINFESEEFSRKFYVTCPDKKFAYDLIHPKMMEHLLLNPNLHIDLCANSILYTEMRVWEPEHVRALIGFMIQFVELIPDYLKRQISSGGNY